MILLFHKHLTNYPQTYLTALPEVENPALHQSYLFQHPNILYSAASMRVKTDSEPLMDRAVIGRTHSVQPLIPNYKLYLRMFPNIKHAIKHLVVSESESEILYDWQFTANQFVLVPSLYRLTTSNFFPN
jgi:hypothetical protein